MTIIGQNLLTRDWLIPDQKRLTELAVAGQWRQSGAGQMSGTGDGGLTIPKTDKLRTSAAHAEAAEVSTHDVKKIVSDEPTERAIASGGAAEYMRDLLRSGKDGQADIIGGLQHTLEGVKSNLSYKRGYKHL